LNPMSILIENVRKAYASGGPPALDGISLAIREGELVALLGPSGSGKTTLLRAIAGLEFIDEGHIVLDGRDTARLPARERGIGFVFQNYALFRHLSVFENVAFGLRCRPRSKRPTEAEIATRVTHLLDLVQLADYAGRRPDALSGGQRQRVALARALAIEPRVLLLDEPFGALDAKVRRDLRRWLRALHEQLGLTTLFVTHDQEEALELADRVAILHRGRLEQVDTPVEVYDRPASRFVAEFLGDAMPMSRFSARGKDIALVRPHDLELLPAGDSAGVQAKVRRMATRGAARLVELELDDGEKLEAEIPPGAPAPQLGSTVSLRARILHRFPAQ